jgi:hypothetical protein
LHEDIANFYQSRFDESDTSIYGTMAHHWLRVLEAELNPSREIIIQVINCVRIASEHAANHGAIEDSQAWLTQAIKALSKSSSSPEVEQLQLDLEGLLEQTRKKAASLGSS